MASEVEQQIARWLEEAVIGLDLCPFAAAVWRTNRVRIAVHSEVTGEAAVQVVLQEASQLLDSVELSTTLVVLPALLDFEEFLDAVATVEAALEEAGAEGLLQVATFHPDYVFADAAADDPANFTNRAPHPVMHLLREAEVAEAVDAHPDPEGIPERNMARLRALGREAIAALQQRINRG